MKHEDLARLVRTVMTHVKSNSWTAEDLNRRLAANLARLNGCRLPAAASASTASGHGHTMATGDTASDPFSRSAQRGRSRPRRCAASGCDDRHHAGLLPRADGTLRSSPGSQKRRSETRGDQQMPATLRRHQPTY